jgi:hypothetical protein
MFISRNYAYLQELCLSPGTMLISRNYVYLQELFLSPGTILEISIVPGDKHSSWR